MKNDFDIDLIDQENILMLHLGHDRFNKNHFLYWYKVLKKFNLKISFLVRDKKSFNSLKEFYPYEQILYAKRPVDVEDIILAQPKLKIVFYSANMAKNIHLLRFNHLNHIFIGSKYSDWISVFNKSYRAYDELWLSSLYVKKKVISSIKKLGHLKIKLVGKPQLEDIILKKNIQQNIIFIFNSVDIENKLFLVEKVYNLYSNKLNIIFYLSQNDMNLKKYIKSFFDKKNFNIKIISDSYKDGLNYFFKNSKLIISDKKSFKVLMLSYNTPLIIYEDKENLESDISLDFAYILKEKDDILNLLEQIETNDTKELDRKNYANFYLGIEETKNKFFYKALKEIL